MQLATDEGSARARDIAYANVITTVFSRTVTGMVPNYMNGETVTYVVFFGYVDHISFKMQSLT
jgi:hypothetical protein